MIIKQHPSIEKRRRFTHILGWRFPLTILLFALAIWAVSFMYKSLYVYFENPYVPSSVPLKKIATAEEIVNQHFHHHGFDTKGIESQSKEFAFEGQFSIKLAAPNHSKGFGFTINNIQIKDNIEASVWLYAPKGAKGSLVLAGIYEDSSIIYKQSDEIIAEQGDWKCIRILYSIATLPKYKSLQLYCSNTSNSPVYFDNLAMHHDSKISSSWQPELIKVGIKEGEFAVLEKKRREAMEVGMLVTEDDSWVKGFIEPNDKKTEKIKISLRLKGDWLDHLEGDQWSFRVKTEPTKSWNRIKVFSLQNARNRGYLNEWVLHRFFNWEDILTPRYEFIQFQLNHKDMGLYVYEEHFAKQLLEYSLRKEGPILKFSETFFWESYLQATKEGADPEKLDRAYSLQISPFSESKTAATPHLATYFKTAQKLMFQYQYGLKKAKDIFDLESLAKYYAIVDITGGHHGTIWHNQRFYYNPITSKLEPIGFDGYGNVADTWIKTAFMGANLSTHTTEKKWHHRLFMDLDFLKKYVFYLNKYAEASYIKTFADTIEQDVIDRMLLIQKTVPYYQYSTNYLIDRAADIRNALKPQSNILQSRLIQPGRIGLCNRHTTVLEIVGTSISENQQVSFFDSSHFVYTTPMKDLPDYSYQISIPEQAQFLVYKVIGLEELYYAPIGIWPIPQAYTAAQELVSNLTENHPAYYYDKENQQVVFKKDALIKSPIIIPKNHTVLIEEGTSINMLNKAFILSYSALKFAGSSEQPIEVTSKDGTSNGVIALNCKEKSFISYTIFSNLNTLNYKGWNQTGAVTFYQSDVDIQHAVFTKNHCEDALNIIRSNFTFEHSTVSHTFADGFDADFCTGLVNNSYFYNTGNDGIDFSTSTITIKNTKIEAAGDKGISIGEAGTATVINTKIDGAVIGIASKDLSKVTIESLSLNNCEIGFAAYQKKPEYGGGNIFVHSYESKNVKKLHQILPDSYLKLKDIEIKGQ